MIWIHSVYGNNSIKTLSKFFVFAIKIIVVRWQQSIKPQRYTKNNVEKEHQKSDKSVNVCRQPSKVVTLISLNWLYLYKIKAIINLLLALALRYTFQINILFSNFFKYINSDIHYKTHSTHNTTMHKSKLMRLISKSMRILIRVNWNLFKPQMVSLSFTFHLHFKQRIVYASVN